MTSIHQSGFDNYKDFFKTLKKLIEIKDFSRTNDQI